MGNLRKINADILKDWLLFIEKEISSLTCAEDKNNKFILMIFLKTF